MELVPVVCALVWQEMGGSGVCGAGSGVGKMVCERMRWDTGWSGVDWFPMAILGGITGGDASVSTLGRTAGVCTGSGDGGGTGGVGCGVSTLGAARVFSLGAGWVWCGGRGRKMYRMRVRASKRSLCSVAGTYLMAHGRKWRAWTMRSSGVIFGCVR